MLEQIKLFRRLRADAAIAENISEASKFLDSALHVLEQGNAAEALRLIERADELNVPIRDLEHARALALYSLERKTEALKAAFDELLDFPDNMAVVTFLSLLAEELGAEIPKDYVESWKRPAPPSGAPGTTLRVGMITPWQVRCGIGSYGRDLVINRRDPNVEYVVFARHDSELTAPDQPYVRRCWFDLLQRPDDLSALFDAVVAERIDLVNVQFNYSFFRIPELGRFFLKLRERGIRVLLTFHSTEPAEILGMNVSAEMFAEYASAIDKVLCYKRPDYERLTRIFGKEKLIQSNLPITKYPRTPAWAVREQRRAFGLADSFVVSTHGFILPNKGLEIILEALGLLKERGIENVKFLSVTSRYVKPQFTDETLARCAAVIAAYGLEDRFILVDDHLDRENIHEFLKLSDLVAFCYSFTQETASGAIRQSVQTSVPVVTTPLPIFADIAAFSRPTREISAAALADEIVCYMNERDRDAKLLAARALYLNNNSAEVLVSELEAEMKKITAGRRPTAAESAAAGYPKISIVSPSFNCAKYIRRCIEGVLAQNYPNFEHIIVDGASTDGTVEILKEYPHLRWISEPDEGEAEALNKALRLATGDVINWLNVDDVYYDNGVLHAVADEWKKNPDAGVIYGKQLVVNEEGAVVMYRSPLNPVTLPGLMRWYLNLNLSQPAMFFSADLIRHVGFFREDLFFSIDYEYWLRIAARGYKFHYLDRMLANATLVREGAKSGNSVEDQHKNWQEIAAVFEDKLERSERINYWRDFYLYRIRNPLGYKEEVTIPSGEERLLGMAFALLEMGDVVNAATVVSELTTKFALSPDACWLAAEVQHRAGNAVESSKTAEIGKKFQSESALQN